PGVVHARHVFVAEAWLLLVRAKLVDPGGDGDATPGGVMVLGDDSGAERFQGSLLVGVEVPEGRDVVDPVEDDTAGGIVPVATLGKDVGGGVAVADHASRLLRSEAMTPQMPTAEKRRGANIGGPRALLNGRLVKPPGMRLMPR